MFVLYPLSILGFTFFLFVCSIFHDSFTASYYIYAFYIHLISPSWDLILCVLYRSHQPLTGFIVLLMLFFLFTSHQPFTGSDSLFMFNIYPIRPWRVCILGLSSISIPLAPGGSYSQFVLYIYPISPLRVRILRLFSIYNPLAPGVFVFSVCALYLSHQPLSGSYSPFVLYAYPISPWRVRILRLCSILIPLAPGVFVFFVCALYLPH